MTYQINLIQITAEHFCAGVEIEHNKVVRAAPIIKYMKGWYPDEIFDYCDRKGWRYHDFRDLQMPPLQRTVGGSSRSE